MLRQPRDDVGGDASRRPCGDEVGHRRPRSVGVAPSAAPGRRRASSRPSAAGEPLRELDGRTATTSSKRFVSSRQTATSRSGSASASDRSVAGSRCGDSNATAGQGQAESSRQSASNSARAARQEADERVARVGEPARDERGLDRRGPGQDSHRDPRVARGPDEARAGIGDAGSPASETSAIRSPAASLGSSSATRAASLCSW